MSVVLAIAGYFCAGVIVAGAVARGVGRDIYLKPTRIDLGGIVLVWPIVAFGVLFWVAIKAIGLVVERMLDR